MKKALLISYVVFFVLPTLKALPPDTIFITSPDKQIQFKLFQQQNQLQYAITYRNVPVVTSSAMVLLMNDKEVTGSVKTKNINRYQINEQYPWLGVHATATNHCNGVRIPLQHGNVADTLDVRVFNDGAAFRFLCPGDDKTSRMPDEATVFNVPPGSTIWYHDLESHYEGLHVKKAISQVQNGEWVAPPTTYKLPQGYYASVTEANLVNYPGMGLQANGAGGLVIRLP